MGREILDSRGNPTVEVDVRLDDGGFGRVAVPSGASTGKYEACELRDGDPHRYKGKGVLRAVQSVNGEIRDFLVRKNASDQLTIDSQLIDLDGTPDKSRLGANAILGVSLAVAKAMANSCESELYDFDGGIDANLLPTPMMNLINGGQHANNSIDIQEFMVIPISADSIRTAVRMGAEVFHTLRGRLSKAGYSTAVGDEGGFAPEMSSTSEALDFLMESIESAGFKPADDVALALDCASSEYFEEGQYRFGGEGVNRSRSENIDFLAGLVDDYPIISIEDGCSENDWEAWEELTRVLGRRCQLVGDDLFVTNCDRLQEGIERKCGNSLLVKPNQIGTLTETRAAVRIARGAGFSTVMSHRSGETEDTTISDLAVALNCGQIKTGSLSRSDRIAKYNRLIRIEEWLGDKANYAGASPFENYLGKS